MKIFLSIFLFAFVVFADGQNTPPKQTTTVYYNSLSWSPDGKTLCFSVIVMDNGVFNGKHWELGSINVETREVTRITNNVADDDWAAYAPDGKRLVFQSDRDGKPQIYTIGIDGKDPQRLSNIGVKEYHPDWSADGKKIVFVSDRDGNPELYKMNIDGTAQTRLTTSPFREYNPQWSPDGKKILYYYEKGDNKDQVYIADNDGKNAAKLTGDSTHNYYPAWVPGGKAIIYASSGGIWQMKIKKPGETKLFLPGTSYAKYAPDGKKIAFKKGPWPSAEIWICNGDGSNPVQLTDAQKMAGLFRVSEK